MMVPDTEVRLQILEPCTAFSNLVLFLDANERAHLSLDESIIGLAHQALQQICQSRGFRYAVFQQVLRFEFARIGKNVRKRRRRCWSKIRVQSFDKAGELLDGTFGMLHFGGCIFELRPEVAGRDKQFCADFDELHGCRRYFESFGHCAERR